MNRLAFTTLALALTAASGSAFADHQDGYGDNNGYDDNGSYYDGNSRYDNNDPRYNNGRYPVSSPRSDYAQVIRVDPIMSQYGGQSGSYQRQECWNERSNNYENGYYRDNSGRLFRGDGRSNTTGALLGALVGGALANQVGNGDGKTAATIAGAVIGAAVGNHTGGNNGYDQYRDSSGVIRRCRTVNDYGRNNGNGYGYGNNQNVTGYNVTYRYAGQTYHAMTRYNPGRTMRVVVDVRPQDSGVAYNR